MRCMKIIVLLICLSSVLSATEPTTKPEKVVQPPAYALDKKFLASADPLEVTSAAMKGLHSHLKAIHRDFDKEALKFPSAWRAAYTTETLEATINIDGLKDFFENTEGKLNAVLEDDLRFIGALRYIPLFAQARKIAESSLSPQARDKQLDDIDSVISKELNRKSISQILGEFMKAHPDLYGK
jgi:hypothetical protein